jgi:hypothetical protein
MHAIKHLCHALLLACPDQSSQVAFQNALQYVQLQKLMSQTEIRLFLSMLVPGTVGKAKLSEDVFTNYHTQQQGTMIRNILHNCSDSSTPAPLWFAKMSRRRGVGRGNSSLAGGFWDEFEDELVEELLFGFKKR